MFGIAHLNVTPIVYGIVIFAAIRSMLLHLIEFRLLTLSIEALVFLAVLMAGGASLNGALGASIASILAGMFIPGRLYKK